MLNVLEKTWIVIQYARKIFFLKTCQLKASPLLCVRTMQQNFLKRGMKRQEWSMIHLASPPSLPGVMFAWCWSFGTDGRTKICVKIVITTGRVVVVLVDQKWRNIQSPFSEQNEIITQNHYSPESFVEIWLLISGVYNEHFCWRYH